MARFVMCFAVGFILGFILAFSLNGCVKTTTTTTKATTTTTTTTMSSSSGDKAAKYLNDIYYGRGERGETAVYITFQDAWYFPCGTPCYRGKPDCFMSYAAFNNKISLKTVGEQQHFQTYSNRQTGWILNSTALENRYGKCAYIFDGTTANRLYGGCGGPAGSSDICGPSSAFSNMCGWKKCTSTSEEVLRAQCEYIAEPQRPKTKSDTPCFWKLPAFDNHSNELKDWYQERLDVQKNSETNLEEWTEIAVDLSVVKKDMMEDASKVIVAFVYNDAIGKEYVTEIRNRMQQQFQSGTDIPIIKIDWTKNVAAYEEVFYFEGGESVLV